MRTDARRSRMLNAAFDGLDISGAVTDRSSPPRQSSPAPAYEIATSGSANAGEDFPGRA
jgi:hypothetical protein